MIAHFTKRPVPLSEQISRLKRNGMSISDDLQAANALERIGYYRLSGYWYPFRELLPQSKEEIREQIVAEAILPGKNWDHLSSDEAQELLQLESRGSRFVPGTTFEAVLDRYEFDRQLRLLLFEGIETVENALRQRLAAPLNAPHAYAHRDPHVFGDPVSTEATSPRGLSYFRWSGSDHADALRELDRSEQRSQETFVRHHRLKYGLPLPLVKYPQVMTIGALSRFYEFLPHRVLQLHASHFELLTSDGKGDSELLKNVLNHLRYIRNMCAHHSRLWNANITQPLKAYPHAPSFSGFAGFPRFHRLFPTIALLVHLVRRIHPSSRWPGSVSRLLFQGAARGLPLQEMGAPAGWSVSALLSTVPLPKLQNDSLSEEQLCSGDFLTTREAGAMMRPAQSDRDQIKWVTYLRKKSALIGLKFGGEWYFPDFQFVPNAGTPNRLVADINEELLRAQAIPPREAYHWWTTSREDLSGTSPAELLRSHVRLGQSRPELRRWFTELLPIVR